MKVVFVIGSPRSGTTIFGEILNCHLKIAEWYEPYYLWEKYFPSKENDVWEEEYLSEKTRRCIRNEFRVFRRKAQKPIVLDKSPGHAFNVEIINKIFPEAKWIHIARDGRDVALSIKKEWDRRNQIVKQKDFHVLLLTAARMLQRQPYWRYRFMALIYEIKSNATLNPLKYLNKSKWEGKEGWGPRFEGWKEYLQTHSSLEYNAMQWVKSVDAVRESWAILPKQNKIEIRYENLLRFREETLSNVLDFLAVEPSSDFFAKTPKLKKDNFNKWKKAFTREEIKRIKPILAPMINDLGYAHPNEW